MDVLLGEGESKEQQGGIILTLSDHLVSKQQKDIVHASSDKRNSVEIYSHIPMQQGFTCSLNVATCIWEWNSSFLESMVWGSLSIANSGYSYILCSCTALDMSQ